MPSLILPAIGILQVISTGFPMFPINGETLRSIELASASLFKKPHDTIKNPYLPPDLAVLRPASSAQPIPSRVRIPFGQSISVQVNVDANGLNIRGDVANEPSIAIDPTNRRRILVGWRQFDNARSDFRQAGRAYSTDGGESWTFPGVLEPGEFASDPVVESDLSGHFYYLSLQPQRRAAWECYLYKSTDGGATFFSGVYAFGGDKEWMVVDKTRGIGSGNIYHIWSPFASCCGGALFTRSTDGGTTFSQPVSIPRNPAFGTLAVSQNGTVYVVGRTDGQGRVPVARSSNARDPSAAPSFDFHTLVPVGGETLLGAIVNPDGLVGQPWIATDRSNGPQSGNIYICGSFSTGNPGDPMDVRFVRSSDGGLTWSAPVRVNDDSPRPSSWQWFGAMSVAPGGRIDVVWYDTRTDLNARRSELYYSSSSDGGRTWERNVPVSPPFEHGLGYPGTPPQRKIGDYFQIISDNEGVSIAYAATFNDEQDVYFLRLEAVLEQCKLPEATAALGLDCNGNGQADNCDIGTVSVDRNPRNSIPDECENDLDGDGLFDIDDADIDGDGYLNIDDACDYNDPGVPGLSPDGRPLGDVDADCRVTLAEYAQFQLCLSQGGPGTPGASELCEPNFDSDRDRDVDFFDAAAFLRAFNGDALAD